jgi:1-deoxy-D-xylulose-5-phosphate reductoisomerase
MLSGEGAAAALASQDDVDVVVNAVVGAAGLAATLAALRRGRTVALANKESLVIGGELVARVLAENGGRLLPIDSEHSALLQALDAGRREDVHRLILTASGGPFLDADLDSLDHATAAQALRHPTWSMGPRITIDSATLVNKALEVVEAHYLYGVSYERIDVLIHPSSIVHSLVEYADGSVIAQLAPHDMRIPIQYALTYPERVDTGISRLDLGSVGRLEFRPLPPNRFPAFDVVLSAARRGGTALAAVNAADEVLVGRFLRDEIPLGAISRGLSETLKAWERAPIPRTADHLEAVLAADRWARALAAVCCP